MTMQMPEREAQMSDLISEWEPQNPSEMRVFNALIRKFGRDADWWAVYTWAVDPDAKPLEGWERSTTLADYQMRILVEDWDGLGWRLKRLLELRNIGAASLFLITRMMHDRGCPVG